MSDAVGQPAFVSQAEFARIKDVSRKTVTGWKNKGLLVVNEQGLVDVTVSIKRLDDRPPCYRGGVTSPGADTGNEVTGNNSAEGNVGSDQGNSPSPSEGDPDASLLDGDLQSIAVAANLTLAEAQCLKENYLALLRKQEFEVSSGKLVDIDDVGRQVEGEYAMVRERLLAIPGKMAALLVDLSRAEIEAALQSEINEALGELHVR